MTRRKRTTDTGLPPGTLVYTGEQKTDKVKIRIIDFNEEKLNERENETAKDCSKYINSSTTTWIDVVGLHDTSILETLGGIFDIHPMVLEDILSTNQRPKMEDQGKHLFIVLKMVYRAPGDGELVAEQVSLIVGADYVLTFQEREGDVFGVIRDRIRTSKGRIRRKKADYLAYSLIDAIVDNYFVVLEDASDRIEDLQEKVITNAGTETLREIHDLKGEIIFMRKNLWPLRELVSALEKSESELMSDAMMPYLRDVYEHTIQVIDTVETLRDTLSGALDIYMTSVSNRMNDIMKVLTIIATIFIPLTFIAGVYGMNFRNMPELDWRYGYAAVWAVMLTLGLGMVAYFRRKKWL